MATAVFRRRASSVRFTKRRVPESESNERQGNSEERHHHCRFMMTSPVLLLMVLMFIQIPPIVEMKYLGPKLSRLVMNEDTGIVYVGGENHLYQLDDDLKLLVQVNTGPKQDSDKCFPPPSACYVNRTATNNYNKVYREQVPAIATRSLSDSNRFSLAEVLNSFSEDRSSAIFIKTEVVPQYPIRYVTGFASSDYNYFLTVQRDTVSRLQHGKLLTKIVQICSDDPLYYSYADIPLRCSKQGSFGNDLDYNVLQAARVVSPGEELAQELFPDAQRPLLDGDVLVGAFTRDVSPEPSAGSKSRRSGSGVDSAVCVFTMKEIRRKFLENIKLCHQGNSSVSGGGYLRVGPRGNCNRQSGLIINNVEVEKEYMCNTNKLESFSNIVGLNPVVKEPILTYPGVSLTAMALTVVNEHTVAFLGTDNGRIKKVVLRQRPGAREYAEEVVSPEGDAILSDLHYSASHRKLYVLTPTNVTTAAICPRQSLINDVLRVLIRRCVMRQEGLRIARAPNTGGRCRVGDGVALNARAKSGDEEKVYVCER
ncbi:plexin-A4 [Elysia marginata]|uniref:Plexin-A4 n=1 Tax=Elysia marginata TaxID=1093978 RepID=A0AAV4GPR3_9GAST|nr:plexin-A4 [Elysia marginata]